jgi:GNAT superfamily N-acetyltransferase
VTTASDIYLREGGSGAAVPAQLLDAIEEPQLVDWQTKWQPALIKCLQDLSRKGVPMSQWPPAWHWDWKDKMAQVEGLLAFRGFSVIAHGDTQGLAQVDLNRSAREPSQVGKPLVYVEYLEVAPWNRAEFGRPVRLQGVGTALLSAAVTLSGEEGFKGRIGLHSLPNAESFYRRMGMTDLGQEPAHQNLRYFEMTADQARTFLKEE